MPKRGIFVLTGFARGDSHLVKQQGEFYPVMLDTIYVAEGTIHHVQKVFDSVKESGILYDIIQVRSVYSLPNPTFIALIQRKEALYVEEKATILVASADVKQARHNYISFHTQRRYEPSTLAGDRALEWRNAVDCKIIVFKPVTVLS